MKLADGMKSKRFFVHRLVAVAFCMNESNKPMVNHIDGNKQNNFYANLEFVTHHENVAHAVRLGLYRRN